MHRYSDDNDSTPTSLRDLLDDDDTEHTDEDSHGDQNNSWLTDDSMNLSSASPLASKPSAIKPPPVENKASDRPFQYYKVLQGWIQAINEAAPLYLAEVRRNPGLSDVQLRNKVSKACAAHLKLVDMCLDLNEVDKSDSLTPHWRRSVAKVIAPLYAHAEQNILEGLLYAAKDWQIEDEEYSQVFVTPPSPEAMLSIKMALLSASMRAHIDLDGLWGSHLPIDVIQCIQSAGLELAKEVSFTWSAKSDITDKESLFKAVLPHSLELCTQAYKDEFTAEMPEIKYLIEDPLMSIPHFDLAVDSLNMGYVDKDRQELTSRVRDIIKAYVNNARIPLISTSQISSWKSLFAEQMDVLMGESWIEASEDFLAAASALSQGELEELAKSGGKMDFSKFDKVFKSNLDRLSDPLIDIEVDLSCVGSVARRHMAWVWGISDSLLTVRNDGSTESYR